MPIHYLDADVEPLWFIDDYYKKLCNFYVGYYVFPFVPFYRFFENIEIPSYVFTSFDDKLYERFQKHYYTIHCTFLVCSLNDDGLIMPELLFDEEFEDSKPLEKEHNKFKFDQIKKMGLKYTLLSDKIELPILPNLNISKPPSMTDDESEVPF
jgi:hypothetical protein